MNIKIAGQRRARTLWVVPLIAAGLVVAVSHSAFADRNALWTIVHDRCVPDEEQHQDPAPCAMVDVKNGENQGYAVLKDLVGATQFLLIPTRRISGIESPDALNLDLPNYWDAAWQARRFVEMRAKHDLAWDMIGLAINSADGRSQDQLHIHIDCVRPDVRATLAEQTATISETWADLPVELRGRHYRARRLDAAELVHEDPFKLLAQSLVGSGQDMGSESLVMIGASFGDGNRGFVLLADRSAPQQGFFAHGEDLLDHACALAGQN